jgi:lon-related putative ATP-dependent protease
VKKAAGIKGLPPEKLAWKLDLDKISFDTSDGFEAIQEIIGQERALNAIKTGLAIKSPGYNIFVTGLAGTGRTSTIKKLLEKLKDGGDTPEDILYVNNFKKPDEPSLILLPPGKGREFRDSMERLIDMLKTNISELLKSEYYKEKKSEIIESGQKKQKEILKRFEQEVSEKGFSVVQIQVGLLTKPELVPVVDEKPTSFSQLEAMVREDKFSEEKLEELKRSYEELSQKMDEVLMKIKEIEEEMRHKLKQWDEESITPIINGSINEIKEKFELTKISNYLDEVENSLIQKIEIFKTKEREPSQPMMGDPFIEYKVNLVIDNSDTKGSPVILENNPNYPNLFGSIEMTPSMGGIIQTDFTKIKAGSFLKANGGYLVINAQDALMEPGVWTTLKRSLKYQVHEIQNYASLYLFSTSRLKPEQIECKVDVVMIGDSYLYNLLYYLDPDFRKIFKVKAEFDTETSRTEERLEQYIRFIKMITKDEDLKAFDKGAMAHVLEYATRMSGRQKKISTRFNNIADIVREAAHWCKEDQASQVSRKHVEKAIKERYKRVSLVEDKIQELIEEGTLLIDTEGAVTGQVNGLSVYPIGEFLFGKPTRITATTSVGRAGVINIEREADLSGRTHNKGVLILTGFLRGKYCQNRPFSLSASLAFEQSYSGVEGDSASSTEVYAILSSLSRLPLRQDIAVTGSINQRGEIQPIGAVNEKIEGFYDVCKEKGITGKQGVIIPHQNSLNLMLRQDVIDAVSAGKFHIYPVKNVDQGMEILTGFEAGELKDDGTFEEDTVNYLVDQELDRLAQSWKQYTSRKEDIKEIKKESKTH